MPIAFERFRIIGGAGEIKNETKYHARLKHDDEDPSPRELPPGETGDILGDVTLEIEVEEP